MKSAEMNAQLDSELQHIPDWPGEHQGELRMLYNMWRRNSLGKNASGQQSPGNVLRKCI